MSKNSPLFVDVGEGLSVMVGRPTIAIWNTAGRPIKPKKGAFGFNSETRNLEFYNGKDWYKAPMEVSPENKSP